MRNTLRTWRRRTPRLGEVDASALGVHVPAVAPGPATPRHVDRAVDDHLARLVGSSRLVVATGPRLAGTTHALARAARLLLGDHAAVRPEPVALTDPAALRDAVHAEVGGPAVLWLDDAPPSMLRRLARLTDPSGDVRVLVTVREELLHPDVAGDALAGLDVVHVPDAVDDAEASRSGALGWAAGDVPGRRAVDLVPARAALAATDGTVGSVRIAAVLRAAADWDRLGLPDALSRSMLAHVAVGYARDLDPRGRTHSAEQLAGAVDALGARRGTLLRRVQRDEHLHHAPDPRLTVVADDLVATPTGWSAPARLVEVADAALTDPDLRRGVGVLALHRRCDGLALRLLADTAPSTVTAATAYSAGLAALECDRSDDARRWFGAVVDGRDPEYRPRAAFWLGLDPDAALDDRRAHLRTVVEEGPAHDAADAAYMLAALERDAGRTGARRHWLRVAAAAADAASDLHRHADALLELAHLDRHSALPDAARQGFAEVVDGGDPECAPEAMLALAAMARDAGDDAGAQDWYRRAAEHRRVQADAAVVDGAVTRPEPGPEPDTGEDPGPRWADSGAAADAAAGTGAAAGAGTDAGTGTGPGAGTDAGAAASEQRAGASRSGADVPAQRREEPEVRTAVEA